MATYSRTRAPLGWSATCVRAAHKRGRARSEENGHERKKIYRTNPIPAQASGGPGVGCAGHAGRRGAAEAVSRNFPKLPVSAEYRVIVSACDAVAEGAT